MEGVVGGQKEKRMLDDWKFDQVLRGYFIR